MPLNSTNIETHIRQPGARAKIREITFIGGSNVSLERTLHCM